MLTVFENIKEALTLQSAYAKKARRMTAADLSIIDNAMIVVEGGRILWIGPKKNWSKSGFVKKKSKKINLEGGTVLPGFVECHTHSIFAGDRSNEFEMRNQGKSYQEIAQAGGGILSSVRATTEASDKELLQLTQQRTKRFVEQGVTTLEIKSGYGLTPQSETRLLKIIDELKGPDIIKTFLGLHAWPADVKGNNEQQRLHVQSMVDLLPSLKKKKLVDRVDVFIENGFFTPEMGRKILEAGKALNLSITGHVEQMSFQGGTSEVIRVQGHSADHVIHVRTEDIERLVISETTAVLLPTSDFYLGIPYPPARKMLDRGVRVAISTDFNPGTAPSQDLSFVGVLARTHMKMHLPEVIVAYTLGAAWALGLAETRGHLSPGTRADFAVVEGSWKGLFYEVGQHPIKFAYSQGRKIF